ncbi:hypothetical protein B0J12DRAFT_60584 [Macrophomina phaseolina]|uniref:Uncharacterized protein n=1 Tax=Macrophomina phaseolina TaxID=35725 RepID=A0ABQ8FPZ0_9PEZI|nr:hypothetical protein B0J12DRAFT_60584 [Macrophomina phaseolina]
MSTTQIPEKRCHTARNPSLSPTLAEVPLVAAPVAPPEPDTRAGFALELIEKWAIHRGEEICSPERHFPVPPSLYLDMFCRWQLASLFARPRPGFWGALTIAAVDADVPALEDWPYRKDGEEGLVVFLRSASVQVDEEFARRKRVRAVEEEAEKRAGRQDDSIQDAPTDAESYRAWQRAQDDRLARLALASRQLSTASAAGSGPGREQDREQDRVAIPQTGGVHKRRRLVRRTFLQTPRQTLRIPKPPRRKTRATHSTSSA